MQLTGLRIPAVALIATASLTLAGCHSSSPSANPNDASQPSASNAANVGPVCPLTGLPQGKNQRAGRPALAVKIDNIAPALPQAGINNADIVFEELVEGGLTRLMAIFQCQSANNVGPIRSARISDADVLALLHGSVLGFSGANPKDLPPIRARSEAVLISQGAYPNSYHRVSYRAAPHNVFSSTAAMLRAGLNQRSLTAPRPLFHYGTVDPSARRAHRVSMSWPAASAVWTWAKNKWLRTQDGSPDRLISGSSISATNVVIMSVDIASTGLHDVLGSPSPLDVTVGSNPVWVLRNGKLIAGTWKRPNISSQIRLVDRRGRQINLTPGRTWVELLPKPNKPSHS